MFDTTQIPLGVALVVPFAVAYVATLINRKK